jgi:glycosyltransferase involved in cell wall biosynthesis
MKNKKIAFFLQSLSGGGAEKSVVNLSNYLVNDGVDIDIVLVNKFETYYLEELDVRVKIVDLNKSRSIKSVFKLIEYMKNDKPDVIMSSVTHINIVMAIAKLLTGKIDTKVVLNQVNHLSSIVGYSVKNKILQKVILKFIVHIYNFTDGVISMSKGVEKDILAIGLKVKSQYIYNPIVTNFMLTQGNGSIDNYTGTTFISVGRMVPQKNFSLLVDAFSVVNKEIESRLIILGEGPLKSDLEEQINNLSLTEDILLPGFVNNPYKYMKNAHVFVLTSLWEGFGNVIAESMALGGQVVSTNCNSGPSEILENGKYGFISSTFNKYEIAKLMIDAVKSPINPELVVERGCYFSVERAAIEYKKFLLTST